MLFSFNISKLFLVFPGIALLNFVFHDNIA